MGPLPIAKAATKVGAACPTLNKTVTEKSSTFICLKSGSKRSWQLLTPDLKIKIEIEKAVTLRAVPKSVTATILQARKDKSVWLDQECSVDFASTVASAPSDFANSFLDSDEVTAITFAPHILASCIATVPTPPAPA